MSCLPSSDKIREGLKKNFAHHDVVEFKGDDSIEKQLKSFATASIVVGPHGAGLTNVMVSALHTPVLEIGPANCPPCFLQLALRVSLIEFFSSKCRRFIAVSGGSSWVLGTVGP